jgi:hypothetical protein
MPKDKLFFIHIPRTSGTSMVAFLQNVYKGKNIGKSVNLFEEHKFEPHLFRHRDVNFAHVDFEDVLRAFNNNYEYITILREPVARYLSHYYWKLRPKPYKQVHKNVSLKEYMEHEEGQRDYNSMAWQLGNHFKVKDRTVSVEEAFEKAKSNLHRFSQILFFDDLARDVGRLSRAINPKGNYGYPKLQASSRAIHVDPVLIDRIRERIQPDIELYKYAKEVFND